MSYEVLYAFENEQITIVEIKRLDIKSEDKSKLYFWLLFDKTDLILVPLVFQEMQRVGEQQFRLFEQGSLLFDLQEATYTTAYEKVKLTTIQDLVLSPHLQNAISLLLAD